MAHHPARPRWPAVVVLWVATLGVGAPASAQATDTCADWLDRLDGGAPETLGELLAGVNRTCAEEHRYWLDERATLDTPTRSWVDATTALQSSRWADARARLGGECVAALTLLSEIAHNVESLPSEALGAFARASHAAFVCPEPESLAAPSVPVISADILELAGVSGGPHAANLFGMPCVGQVPEEPSHVFEVTAAQRVSLVATAQETGDLSLVLTGPGGTWCDDDAYGLNPALSERLIPGRYAVFVGEASAPGRSTRYRLFASAQPLPVLLTGAAPTVAAVSYPRGAQGVYEVSGRSAGDFNAELVGPSCTGRIASQPDFQLVLSEPARVSIEVRPTGTNDLSIAVLGGASVICAQDPGAHRPAISTWLSPGRYDVWVGRLGTGPADYRARFSEDDLFGIEPGVLTPLFDTATLDEAERSVLLSGVASGEEPASGRFGPFCSGFISFEPNHTLYLAETARVWIDASPGRSSPPGHAGVDFETGDLTMVVTGPSGTFCSDDFRGRDPGLSETLAAGTYDVYVGERALSPVGTSYGLRAALAEPLIALEPPARQVHLTPGARPWHGWGQAFGEVAASALIGSSCEGDLPSRPSFELTLTEAAEVVVAAGSGALGRPVLAMTGPGGGVCGVDEGGAGPRIETRLPAGAYEVYVGEVFGTELGTSYALSIAAEPAEEAPPPIEEPLPPSGETVTVELGSGFAAQESRGRSGGPMPARFFASSCAGHVPEQPQLVAHVTEAGRYRFEIVAAGDTTLVIDGPGGPYCNDDAVDFNPALETWLEAGEYRVFVGSYSRRLTHDYALVISRRP